MVSQSKSVGENVIQWMGGILAATPCKQLVGFIQCFTRNFILIPLKGPNYL